MTITIAILIEIKKCFNLIFIKKILFNILYFLLRTYAYVYYLNKQKNCNIIPMFLLPNIQPIALKNCLSCSLFKTCPHLEQSANTEDQNSLV